MLAVPAASLPLARTARTAGQPRTAGRKVDRLRRPVVRALAQDPRQAASKAWKSRNAINIVVAGRGELAHHAHFHLFAGIHGANNDLLFGGELVLREDACAVAAEHHGLGLLGEDAPFDIASNQKDSELFGNAAAATPAFGRHMFVPRLWKGALRKKRSG